jgi:hypothetical protein
MDLLHFFLRQIEGQQLIAAIHGILVDLILHADPAGLGKVFPVNIELSAAVIGRNDFDLLQAKFISVWPDAS